MIYLIFRGKLFYGKNTFVFSLTYLILFNLTLKNLFETNKPLKVGVPNPFHLLLSFVRSSFLFLIKLLVNKFSIIFTDVQPEENSRPLYIPLYIFGCIAPTHPPTHMPFFILE